VGARRTPSHAATAHGRRVEQHDRRQALLRESLRSTTTVDEVADTLAVFCSDELDAAWGGLLLHEHKRGSLRRIDGRHVEPGKHDWAAATSSTSGPAAAAISRRRVLVFDDISALLADFPVVGRWGRPPATGTVAFVPLLLADGALGSAVIWWENVRPVTAVEGERLTALARSVAQAVDRIETAAEQRADAETLQRSLLTRLPRPDGLELHARYVPAGRGREIGGDWYDAIILNDGSTALMIGDVTGHDMAAAAQMGQLRGLLRGFAFDRDEPPSGIVRRLDRTCAGLGIDTLATLTLARLDGAPAGDGSTRMTWTNAGHLPPVLLHTDGRTELLETTPEAMLGLEPDADRSDHVHHLPPGTTVLLYTDGLVERRDRDVRTGIEHLRVALTRLRRRPLQTMLNMLVSQVAGDQPQDDVALLAARSRWAPPSAR
jgi:serine phosphatase RsbU (regulator of sigma subunit)